MLLPLRMSGQQEVAALWECAACGAAFAGVLLLDSVATRAQAVRLAQLHFGNDHVERLPDDFSQVVLNLDTRQVGPPTHERRRSPRDFRHVDAIAVGLDANFILADQSCRGIVVNLSSHGMLIATPQQLRTTHVAIQIQGALEKVQVLGRVVWARQFVRDCYGTGIDFAARLGKVPSASDDPSHKAVGAVEK
jgi:PilZ domain-containing protein